MKFYRHLYKSVEFMLGLVLDTSLWSALPADVDGALEKSSQPDTTFFGSIRDKDPVLVQLQPVGYEVVAESETLFWNSQGKISNS
jgi:hypothetical protein